MAFLTTIVKDPDRDYDKKLGRFIKYLRDYPETPIKKEPHKSHFVSWKWANILNIYKIKDK